jgi:hypothetical protein
MQAGAERRLQVVEGARFGRERENLSDFRGLANLAREEGFRE